MLKEAKMVDAVMEKKKTGAEDVLWDLSIFYTGVDDTAIQRDVEKSLEMATSSQAGIASESPHLTLKK